MMRFDRNGVLVFADVVGSGVAKQAAGTRSGNPNHDTRSGKFGGGGGPQRATPSNVDPAAYARYLDAVREAARKFPGDLSDENIASFIKSRAANPTAVNIAAFAQLAQAQQIQDVIDALDNNHGGFKLEAPKGYVAKVLAGISDDDVTEIVARLKARGIKDPHIKFGRSLPKDRHETIKAKTADRETKQKEAVTAFDFDPPEEMIVFMERPPEKDWALMADAITASIAKLPQPVINVAPPEIRVEPQITVQAPEMPRTRKIVERDENGLIANVREVVE